MARPVPVTGTAAAEGTAGTRPGPFPRALTHELAGHPLLTLDALADAALELQRAAGAHHTDAWPVEHHLGDLPEVLPGGAPPQAGHLDTATMIRTVEENGCWVVLWNVEQLPRYAALLDSYLAQVQPTVTPDDRQVYREGFIFISAPDTVTPVHIDPEHNALLQITGEKTISVGSLADRSLWHREIERVILGGDRHLPVAADHEQPFVLTPGHGAYVPPFAPHKVRNGPTTCISLSVTWRTERAYRAEQVHRVNGRLRRMGLRPTPPGDSRLRDGVKVAGLRAGGRVVRTGRSIRRGGLRYDPSKQG
jgi:hypothetical protein